MVTHLSAATFARVIPDGYPFKADVLYALEWGVGLLPASRPVDLSQDVFHSNSWTLFRDLASSRASREQELALGRSFLLRAEDPMPLYVASCTAGVKVVDVNLNKFDFRAELELLKPQLRLVAKADHANNVLRNGVALDPPLPPLPGFKMRLCFNGTGFGGKYGDGPNSYGDVPYVPMPSLWPSYCSASDISLCARSIFATRTGSFP